MKKTIYLLLSLFIGLQIISSCKKEQNIENTCNTQFVCIDTLSKYCSTFDDGHGNIIDSRKWQWDIRNDTIFLLSRSIPQGESDDMSFLFFKKEKECISYLNSADLFIDDQLVIDENTGEITYWGSYQEFFEEPFVLQDYVEDDLLVGQVKYNKFWIEMTPDNRFDISVYDFYRNWHAN